jgi:CelD/BcsL family acetyltransferase involved in cellulose biosynthesis
VAIEQISDFAAAREQWTLLAERAGNVFATWEWADAWYSRLGDGAPLALALVRDKQARAVAILPLFVPRARPIRLLRFLGAGLGDQSGPVCAPQDRRQASAALRRWVAEGSGDAGVFLGERLWGGDWSAAELGGTVVGRIANPVLPAEGRSFEQFLASRSRNFREQVRRRERRLARERALVYRLTEDPDRVEPDMRTLIRLHQARWREGESNVFAGPRAEFHIEFARRALANGWLRLWTMELDGAPVAAWYGFRFGGVESYYQAGRDPAFDADSVGFVLLSHTIRSALDDGVREYRFGSGDEPYKSRFAEHDPGLETIAVPAGIAGRLAVGAVRLALRMPKSAQRVVRRFGARERDGA